MLLYGSDKEISHWVCNRLGVKSLDPCRAIGIIHDKSLIGGIVYSNYRDGNIEISMAVSSPKWGTRQNFRALLGYPFRQLGCRRVTCLVKAKNQSVRTFLCRLGFREEGILRQGFVDDDAAILGMLKAECRWLEELDTGQK